MWLLRKKICLNMYSFINGETADSEALESIYLFSRNRLLQVRNVDSFVIRIKKCMFCLYRFSQVSLK
jgi:hypothetical protein